MSNIQKTVLPNGVRVISESVDYVASAAIGVWCRTGSVDETEHEAGITHLIEHMLFKGTETRDSRTIAQEIEGRGGMVNAFTDKEQTCYYCRVLSDDVQVGVDVLTDMVVNSKLDSAELDKEKGVVIEEIKRGEDEPGDYVHDLHLQGLWGSHPLGLPIIGTRDSVAGFSRENLTGYMKRRYTGGHVMVAAVGQVDHAQLVDLANRALAQIPSGTDLAKMDAPAIRTGQNLVAKDVEQVHFCIGGAGVSLYDDELYAASVMDGILGSGMSSRLFQEVREKRGLAYSVGSYHLAYTHGGAFTIFGGTGAQTWAEVQAIVRKELDDLIVNGPHADELAKVKRQIAGNLVLGQEGMSARMMRMARNEFVHGRYIPLEETRAKIEAVTEAQVQALAARVLREDALLTTAIGPFAA